MRRGLFALALCLACLPLAAAPISPEVHGYVMAIARNEGVPESVANQLQIEESGDWQTGTWGDAGLVNKFEPGGWCSVGLFQIYMKPENISFLLTHYWYGRGEVEPFDPFNPIHSAKMALRYLADLHKRYGNWYTANVLYNGAGRYSYIRARRIVNAR